MVGRDVRNVKTGAKSPPERAPLRRLSSLENKGVRKSPGGDKTVGKIVAGLKEIDGEIDMVVAVTSSALKRTPHYQLPTTNSSNQARVLSKPLTPPPPLPPDFARNRRISLGSEESAVSCKYEKKCVRRAKNSGLRSPRAVERPAVKISGLKASRVVEKTPLNPLKPSRAVEESPVKSTGLKSSVTETTPVSKSSMVVAKTPGRRLSSTAPRAARDTCSSSCKHVVKGRDLTVSSEPRCPYKYCSLHHLNREEQPPLKQFLASRRRLLRTQKSFKWVGLTPVPKGSVDRGGGVETSSVVDTGQELCLGAYEKDAGEDHALVIGVKSDDGHGSEACQIVECDDYEDGHSTEDGLVSELGGEHQNDVIKIAESLLDESDVKGRVDGSMDLLVKDGNVEVDNHEFDVEAPTAVKDESVKPVANDDAATNGSALEMDGIKIAECILKELDVKGPDDESMELPAEVSDGEDHNHVLYGEESAHENDGIKIVGSIVDASNDNRRDDESMELLADDAYELDAEEYVRENDGIKFSESVVDELDVKERNCESMELCTEDDDVEDDNEQLDLEASVCDVTSNCSDHDQIEDNEGPCFIQVNALGAESTSTEPHGLLGASLSEDEVDSGLKDGVTGDDCVPASFEWGSVSKDIQQYSVWEDDYDQIENIEQRCFIPVHVHGPEGGRHAEPEGSRHTEPDGLPGVAYSDVNSGFKDAVQEESEAGAKDQIEQSAGCDNDQLDDIDQSCFIQVHAQETECSSHTEPDSSLNASFSEVDSGLTDEVKEEHVYDSRGSECGSTFEGSANGHADHFTVLVDDQSGSGGSGNEFTKRNSNKYDEFDDSSSENGDGKAVSPPDSTVIDLNSRPKQDSKEECTGIVRSLYDGFDDDYNLTSLFSELKDDSRKENESDFCIQTDFSMMQFNIHRDVDNKMDESLSEASINPTLEKDINALVVIEDDNASEIYDNDFENQYLECEDAVNEILGTNSELYHSFQVEAFEMFCSSQAELANKGNGSQLEIDVRSISEMEEECCDISEMSLNESVTECKHLKKEFKRHRSIAGNNENKPYRLKFRRGRVHPFEGQIAQSEKVDLRHQTMEERRAAHEWMVDYALRKIVNKLSPCRQRKVKMLVEAFETVAPDLPHDSRDISCSRPMQVCN